MGAQSNDWEVHGSETQQISAWDGPKSPLGAAHISVRAEPVEAHPYRKPFDKLRVNGYRLQKNPEAARQMRDRGLRAGKRPEGDSDTFGTRAGR